MYVSSLWNVEWGDLAQWLPTQGLRVRSSLAQTKTTETRYVLVFAGNEMLPRISAIHGTRKRNWFVTYCGLSSILHDGPLIETFCMPRRWIGMYERVIKNAQGQHNDRLQINTIIYNYVRE